MSISNAYRDDVLPVEDDLLGELYRCDPLGLSVLVRTIPETLRASLAVYCYRRAHLQGIAIAIASTCQDEDLIAEGGFIGSILISKTQKTPGEPSEAPQRRKITLPKSSF
jgi:hypothetical protein